MVRPTNLVEGFLPLAKRFIGRGKPLAEPVNASGEGVQAVSEATARSGAFLLGTVDGGIKLCWSLIQGDSRGQRTFIQGKNRGVGRRWTRGSRPRRGCQFVGGGGYR